MKFLVFFGLIALAAAAPQPRKLFHEHLEDFMTLILEEAGQDIGHVFEHYLEFEEFTATLDYLKTQDFKDIIYELEALPEFKAVVDFLENDNIDILYFIDRFNEMIEGVFVKRNQSRQMLSGTNFHTFINDVIAEFPKSKLNALFQEKMAEDESFRVAFQNLNSDEWWSIYGNLWASETFRKEISVLEAHGIYIDDLLTELRAVFGLD